MNNKLLKQQILEAAEKDIPDIRHKLNLQTKPNTQTSWLKSWFKKPALTLSFSAMAILLIVSLVMNTGTEAHAKTNVFIEFNPGLSMVIEADKAIELSAENPDGATFINTLNNETTWENKPLDEVLETIITVAVEQGYLTGEDALIMYDVYGENLDEAKRILDNVEGFLEEKVTQHNPNAMVARGMASMVKETVDTASEHNMSVMKYQLIINILAIDETYTFETLSDYSIKDLMDLSNHHGGPFENMPGRPNSDERPGPPSGVGNPNRP